MRHLAPLAAALTLLGCATQPIELPRVGPAPNVVERRALVMCIFASCRVFIAPIVTPDEDYNDD